MKKVRVYGDLEYDEDVMHGNDTEAIEWFKEVLYGDSLYLSDFGDLGDLIGKFKVRSIHE